MKKTTLITLALLSAALHAQVPLKGSTVDATQGYTVNGAAPSGQTLCGNGVEFVPMATCGATQGLTSFQGRTTQAAVLMLADVTGLGTLSNNTSGSAGAVGGVPLSGLCQTGGTGCPNSGITGTIAPSGFIRFPNGLIMQWMPGPTVTEAGDSLHTGTWPTPFPNAIFGATCSTTTAQGGSGTPGDTDIHVMQMSASSASGWTVRHSVGGVYTQAQTVSCFLTAIGN